ncbi:unnamed protein product [Amaranthus hypochondriacus]
MGRGSFLVSAFDVDGGLLGFRFDGDGKCLGLSWCFWEYEEISDSFNGDFELPWCFLKVSMMCLGIRKALRRWGLLDGMRLPFLGLWAFLGVRLLILFFSGLSARFLLF